MENIAKIVGGLLLAILAFIILKYLMLLLVNILGFIGVSALNFMEFFAIQIGLAPWIGWFLIWTVFGAGTSLFVAHRFLPATQAPPQHFPKKPILGAETARLALALAAAALLFWSSGGAAASPCADAPASDCPNRSSP